MTTPKQNPPPRTLQPAEERKIQAFLERAAPIVLEDPTLTKERWQQLAELAHELDLSAHQFRSTIDDLLNRGVIKRTDVIVPSPPPLPGQQRSNSPLKGTSESEDFSLTAPTATPPVHPPTRSSVGSSSRHPTASEPETRDTTARLPGGPMAGRLLPLVSDQPTPKEAFRERAGAILAEFRGVNAKSQALLAAISQELGLSDSEVREVLGSLQSPRNVESKEEQALRSADGPSTTRWRVEGEPVPVPPPPPKTAAETFLDFARPSLAAVRDGVVPAALEQRILAHGTRVLGLSTVYARHLLLDLIAERMLRLVSQANAPPPANPAPESTPTDPRIAAFLKAARPVLAQHRGVTTHSRILLASLAREHHLTEQEIDTAILSLSTRPPDDPIDRAQQERLAPYSEQVESSLKKASRGILTPVMQDKLVNAGCELFGIDRGLALATVRENADRLALAVITHEQAEQHLVHLLQDVLPIGAKLTPPQRERIEQEGAQWGLEPVRVAELIHESCRRNEEQAIADARMNKWALNTAVGAVVLLALFLLWAFIESFSDLPDPAVQPPSLSQPVAVPRIEREESWVDNHGDLAIAVINARSDLPGLRKELTDLASTSASRRDTAYVALVDYLFRPTSDERHRQGLAELLAYCVALDPVDSSADRLMSSLLRDLSVQSAETPLSTESISRTYFGVRTVATGLAYAAGQTTRLAQIVAALHRAVGVAPDPSLPPSELQASCARGLSLRLFHILITSSGTTPAGNLPLHAVLVAEATRHLDAAQIDKFNADFLVSLLSKQPSQLGDCEQLIAATAKSQNPLAVLRLVELYESTSQAALRAHLQQQLLQRTAGSPPGTTVEEIAAFVRQTLGISDSHDPDGTWAKLSREAQDVLNTSTSPPDPNTPILKELLKLAHFESLACAFVQGEWSNAVVVELRKAGPRAPDSGLSTGVSAERSESPIDATATLDRATLNGLKARIDALSARRSGPTDRLAILAVLAETVDQIPDLPPELAAALASYLLTSKSSSEHEQSLERVTILSRWNQLVLALADRIEESSLPNEPLQSLVKSLGSGTPLPPGKEGKAAARQALLQLVLRRLDSSDSPAARPVTTPENTAALLADSYALQARLLTISLPSTATSARDPQATLRGAVDGLLSQLSATKLSESPRATLNQIPHQLVAREFMAEGQSIQRLVTLERTWLELLAVEATRRGESRQAAAETIINELRQQDRKAGHVLTQLRDGHRALLQMWLLIGRRG